MNITPEVIEALRTLRMSTHLHEALGRAIDVLDNAGVFAAIDEATDYDVDPEPVKVSKCTCTQLHRGQESHDPNCPGDPAEWGDMAYTTAPMKRFSDLTDEELEQDAPPKTLAEIIAEGSDDVPAALRQGLSLGRRPRR